MSWFLDAGKYNQVQQVPGYVHCKRVHWQVWPSSPQGYDNLVVGTEDKDEHRHDHYS